MPVYLDRLFWSIVIVHSSLSAPISEATGIGGRDVGVCGSRLALQFDLAGYAWLPPRHHMLPSESESRRPYGKLAKWFLRSPTGSLLIQTGCRFEPYFTHWD